MEIAHIKDPAIFEQWLEEERHYLVNLSQEPIDETLAMDYYQSLVDLKDAEYDFDKHIV